MSETSSVPPDALTDAPAVGLVDGSIPATTDRFVVCLSDDSVVATRASYATFLLYGLLETEAGRELLGAHAPNTRALVFNAKGEDLLHLDRPNSRFDADSRTRWAALGVASPGPFTNVE